MLFVLLYPTLNKIYLILSYPFIFMFGRGWLREQVARAMSRQLMPIS